ncbi:MAG: hypothetical protein LLG04_15405 [Parachlamydia sp.]|nr:hypothetical protein [Parachlamydia sp.]
MSFNLVYSFQNTLSRAQAKPVIGPLFVSPVKAVAGIVQTVACVALSFFLGLASNLFLNFGIMSSNDRRKEKWFQKARVLEKAADKALACVGYGLGSVAYSFANMATLGIAAYRIETHASTIRWPV